MPCLASGIGMAGILPPGPVYRHEISRSTRTKSSAGYGKTCQFPAEADTMRTDNAIFISFLLTDEINLYTLRSGIRTRFYSR